MTELEKFIKENDVEFCKDRVKDNFLSLLNEKLNINPGDQLRFYIVNYGYLAYKFVELYGVTASQAMNSDMIRITAHLHKNYDCTKGFIALEDAGDGDYFLIDSQDHISEFIPEEEEGIKPLNIKLFDYIIARFKKISIK